MDKVERVRRRNTWVKVEGSRKSLWISLSAHDLCPCIFSIIVNLHQSTPGDSHLGRLDGLELFSWKEAEC